MKIGFIPTIAGAGATSLALEITFALARRGQQTTLVDADPSAELSARTRTRPSSPLKDVFGWSESDARNATGTQVDSGVVVVPADGGRFVGAGLALSPLVLSACADAFLARGPVLVDLPPPGSPSTSAALGVLDGVIGIVPATAAGVRSLAPFLRLVLGARTLPGGPPALVALVLCQVRDGELSASIARDITECTGDLVPTVIAPWDPSIEAAALRTERSTTRMSAISACVTLLAEAIFSRGAREVVARGPAVAADPAPIGAAIPGPRRGPAANAAGSRVPASPSSERALGRT